MKISIALCTYNGEKYLEQQLNSFLRQTHPPDEIVINDDNSTDSTCEIIEHFATRSPIAVRFSRNKQNLRTVKNFEKAIALCTGDIIALSDQDDVWQRDKLRIFADVFDCKPEVGLVFCDAEVVDENLNQLGVTNWQLLDFDSRRQQLLKTPASFDYLLKNIAVFGCTMAFRARFKKLVLPIENHVYRVIHDNWIAILISAVAKIEPVPQCLVNYRQHSAQQIGHRQNADEASFIENALVKHDFDDEILLLQVLLDRLKAGANDFPAEAAIKLLASRLRHFEQRRAMRNAGVKKIRLIAEEILTARYSAHTNGLRSAVKDLFTA